MTAGIALSPEQERVLAYSGGELQVIACASSGKTESIFRRIPSLIAESAEAACIVAFRFTEGTAAELKERIARRVGEVMGSTYHDRLGPTFVGTIHAHCCLVLQDHVPSTRTANSPRSGPFR
jgi:DNA helicase-2/ATP-dependent DNA helicase PcrA